MALKPRFVPVQDEIHQNGYIVWVATDRPLEQPGGCPKGQSS